MKPTDGFCERQTVSGFIVDEEQRQGYNKPKSENAKQPKCPKEKEDAIEEALKYFKMV